MRNFKHWCTGFKSIAISSRRNFNHWQTGFQIIGIIISDETLISFILIDEATSDTVGAGMVVRAGPEQQVELAEEIETLA